ncbi:hypothetical protein, partial [Aeromonas veronii]|uniref:hypothetical protein n=1 Tax=Aeromonas veronii TaxID=654 RepID=UPI0030041659
VSMMVDLKVMAYFKISLSTRNWDRAIKNRPRPVFCFALDSAMPCRQGILQLDKRGSAHLSRFALPVDTQPHSPAHQSARFFFCISQAPLIC